MDDLFAFEALLRPEERIVRDEARAFLAREVADRIGRHWEEGTFPRDIVPRFGEMGFLGATLPETYGGSSLPPLAWGLLLQELERVDSALRSFVSVQSSLVMQAIYRFGSDDQKKAYLPALARGELIGCFGLTEPEGGSDPASMQTRAIRMGPLWRIRGRKRWITNAGIADIAVVFARVEATPSRVQGFLVPKDARGFAQEVLGSKGSMRASVTGELILDDVELSDAYVLPGATGLGAALTCLDEARFGIALGVVGAAIDCYEEAKVFVASRKAFSGRLSGTQLVQERLVDMLSRIVRSQLVGWRLARLKEEGKDVRLAVALAKRDNTRAALEVARMARGLLAAQGISLVGRTFRHLANLETVETYEGTYEVQTLIVGRGITGVDAFAPPVSEGRKAP